MAYPIRVCAKALQSVAIWLNVRRSGVGRDTTVTFDALLSLVDVHPAESAVRAGFILTKEQCDRVAIPS